MWSEMTIGARRLGGRRRNRRRAEYAAGRARAFLIHSVAVRHARDVARVLGAGRAVGEDNRRRARAVNTRRRRKSARGCAAPTANPLA